MPLLIQGGFLNLTKGVKTMARKFSLAYLTIPGVDPVNQIKIAKEAGYDFVSLRTIPMHLPGEPSFLPQDDPELFEAIKKALKEYDMPLMDIELARIRKDLDINEYKPAFEAAAKLGATDVLGSVWTRDRAWYTIEFLPWAGVRNLQEDITLIDDLGRDNVFVMVDTLHAGRAGVTGSELARTPRKYFNFIHLCDGPAPEGAECNDTVLDNIKDDLMLYTAREARYYPGEGNCKIADMIKAMPNIPLSIELPNLKEIQARGNAGHAARCLEVAKAYFAANGIE